MLDPFRMMGTLAGWQRFGGLWLPGLRAFQFTPNCCCDCTIFNDDFERTSVGGNWEIKSGTWSIVQSGNYWNPNNSLQGCGTGSRILWTGLDDLTDNVSIGATVTFTTANQKCRLFFGGDDSSAYYAEFAWLEPGSGWNPMITVKFSILPESRLTA